MAILRRHRHLADKHTGNTNTGTMTTQRMSTPSTPMTKATADDLIANFQPCPENLFTDIAGGKNRPCTDR
jgi:hypothetical protein